MPLSRTHIALLLSILLTLLACDPGKPDPRIHTLHPTPIEQGQRLVLFGDGLGAYEPGHSVRVGASCADLVFWADDAIAFTIPTAIGVGLQPVTLRWADGKVLRLTIDVVGQDLPPRELICKPGLVSNLPPLPEPDVVSDTENQDMPTDGSFSDGSFSDGTGTVDSGFVD